MDGNIILSGSILAALIIEGIKWIVIYYKKDSNFDFPAKFYLFLLPVLSYLSGPFLAWLGISGYSLPNSLEEFGKQFIIVALTALAAVIEYKFGLKGLSDHARARITLSNDSVEPEG